MKTLLIIGGSGFLGKSFLDYYNNKSFIKWKINKIIFISRKGINNENVKNLSKNDSRNFFFNNLHRIGYRYFNKKKSSKYDSKVIKAFQRRFRQNKVNGLIDQKCLQISHYLASSLKY